MSKRQENLRELMARKGLTSGDVARLVGVHPVTVRRWMCGTHEPPMAAMLVVAAIKTKGAK